MSQQRKNITQPADWWAAFEAEAAKRNMPLSTFMGMAAAEMLDEDLRKELSKRSKSGRKKNKA